MTEPNMTINEESRPRFEFRSFGRDFSDQSARMARLSMPVSEKVGERHSDEIYIMSRTNDINNTKIRDGKLDIKTYVQTIDGLEQWNPLMKAEFPLSRNTLEKEVFSALQVDVPKLEKNSFSYEEFIKVINSHADLQTVKVHKQRFGYMINDTICETGNILIDDTALSTINSESTEIKDVKKTMSEVGLDGFENINYLQAIKRVIGMIDKDLAN